MVCKLRRLAAAYHSTAHWVSLWQYAPQTVLMLGVVNYVGLPEAPRETEKYDDETQPLGACFDS